MDVAFLALPATRRRMTGLRPPTELIRLAERYAKYLREPTANPYLAWGRLGQIIRALHPTQAFDLACHLLRQLPGSCLQSFGSGTLAHLIHHHGATLIDLIERAAWRDVDFLEALSNAWIAREDLDPAVLARLRLATGACIQIVTLPERDARYRAVFEQWKTGRAWRSPPSRKPSPRMRPSQMESIAERYARLHAELPSLPARTDAAKSAWGPKQSLWWLRRAVLFTRLQVALLTMPPVARYMAQGAVLAWLPWFLATGIAARLLLPVLVVVLSIASRSPASDLALVVGTTVLTTIGAALAGLAIGVRNQRRGQLTGPPLYLTVISLVPFLTIFALIARTKHGLIVAPAVVVGLISLSFIVGLFQRARRWLNRARRLDRQATART